MNLRSAPVKHRTRGSPVRGKSLCTALCLAALSSTCIAAQTVTSVSPSNAYAQLVSALTEGKNVHVDVDFSQCTATDSHQAGPHLRGGMQIGSFLISDGQFIAFSDTHPTLDAHNRPVTEYIRYRVMPDGLVSIQSAAISGASDTASPRGTYQCAMGRGVNFR